MSAKCHFFILWLPTEPLTEADSSETPLAHVGPEVHDLANNSSSLGKDRSKRGRPVMSSKSFHDFPILKIYHKYKHNAGVLQNFKRFKYIYLKTDEICQYLCYGLKASLKNSGVVNVTVLRGRAFQR